MSLFEVAIWTMLLAGFVKGGWLFGKWFSRMANRWYENKLFKNHQKQFKTYMKVNRYNYEEEQDKEDSGEDQEIPKRE